MSKMIYTMDAQTITRIVEAWEDAGSHPNYHEECKSDLKEKWPTLYYALLNLVAEQTKKSAPQI